MPSPLRAPAPADLGIGALAVGGAVLGWVGAVGAWLAISVFSLHFSLAGTSTQLDGGLARALAIAGLVVAVCAPLVRGRLRLAALTCLLGVAGAGLGLVGHEAYHLESVDAWLRGIPHLQALAQSLGIGASAAWGLYACGAGFGLMLAAAVAGLLVERQRSRSAPPSTGITQPVRYDAAGESTNAAT